MGIVAVEVPAQQLQIECAHAHELGANDQVAGTGSGCGLVLVVHGHESVGIAVGDDSGHLPGGPVGAEGGAGRGRFGHGVVKPPSTTN